MELRDMTHHEHHHGEHHGQEHDECGPPTIEGGLGPRMGICPCSQCGNPMGREEETTTLEKYKKAVEERLEHVERRLEELRKR
jgi:hypothetical protein